METVRTVTKQILIFKDENGNFQAGYLFKFLQTDRKTCMHMYAYILGEKINKKLYTLLFLT